MNRPNETPDQSFEAPGLKYARLSQDGIQAIPANLEFLNPEEEGKRSCLYLVWFLDTNNPENPGSFDDSAFGRGICHPFGFFTDYPDLYITGQQERILTTSHLKELTEEWFALWRLMADAAARELPEGAGFAYAFCLCDCLGREVPVGTTSIFIPRKGSEDESA